MKIFTILASTLILMLSSCSSIVRPVAVTNISQSKYMVEVFAIHWTSTDSMRDTAQEKAAEIAMKNGYEWFTVDDFKMDTPDKGDYKLSYYFTCGSGEKPKDAIAAKEILKKSK